MQNGRGAADPGISMVELVDNLTLEGLGWVRWGGGPCLAINFFALPNVSPPPSSPSQ